jgi:polyisoprenoid-binding protein YceI
MIKYTISLLILFTALSLNAQELYKVLDGKAKFISDAPLELIQAQTSTVNGLLKVSDRSFAFSIPMSTFDGFNSKLQKTHFNENYIQTAKYPNATFEGKIIEEIDFSAPGKYEVRGKGKFQIHGVEQVRIIKCTIIVSKSKIVISSKFTVLLADHNIKIPSVVAQKITEEVAVEVNINMVPK